MTTVSEQRAQDEQDQLKAELRRQREVAAAKVAELDAKLEAVEDANFVTNLGHKELASMTTREKARLVEKLGFDKFTELLTGRR